MFASQGSRWEVLEDDLSAPTGGWTGVTLSISLCCTSRLGECDCMGDGRWLASGWSQNVERRGWNGIGEFRRISSHRSSYLEIFRPKSSPSGGTSSPRRMANNSSSTILWRTKINSWFSSWIETYLSCCAKNSSVGKEKSAIYIDSAIGRLWYSSVSFWCVCFHRFFQVTVLRRWIEQRGNLLMIF